MTRGRESREREEVVDVRGVRLRTIVEGRGPAILVLHGFTGAAESMESVSASLRERFTVVRLELIGHGGSDAPRDEAAYAMEACANQIAETVRALRLW